GERKASRHACAVSALRTIGEVNDFERVVVWVMEIGAAAGEHALIALLLPEHIHAPGFEFRHRRVVGVAIDHEGIMNDVGKSPAARVAAKKDIAGAGFEKYENADSLLALPPRIQGRERRCRSCGCGRGR